MTNTSQFSIWVRRTINWAVTVSSVILCSILLLTRLPGMELLGIAPNWLLIWVVAWSIKRTAFQGAFAGLVLGLVQDGMTFPEPTHVYSLAIVGILTALIQKQRYIQEDFISVALIVFGMAIVGETVTAIQHSFQGSRQLAQIWTDHQRIAICSAILSSLWAPVVYYPLNRWWQWCNSMEQS
ncbi:rod shape-determining protein MreD [Moorena producens JHB]|uniref:Rod shape-determining protein MreD n=1 Tax=Moorena producens (strain JHB) TaxID=1454205 RepID=A0A1D9G107_MOOP1|nr:rod shape-determining protein MreD [Moorena producens]AOY81309.1 rod shape-determining protein MreD [Moorena producens JHB]